MDDRRFDDLTRRLATASRRGLLKALLGAAGGGLLALVGVRPAAAARPCGASVEPCDGCCGGPFGFAIACRPGTEDVACGRGGETCFACPPGTFCRGGVCVPCDATTCPDGCCDRDGRCREGDARDACGAGGGRCQVCSPTEACRDGVCVEVGCTPETCPLGCCQDGACVRGASTLACGRGGSECDRCDEGELCRDGACQQCREFCADGCCYPPDGCYLGGRSDPARCGVGGVMCDFCDEGEGCYDGVCLPRGCRPETCSTGCCDADGVCRDGTSDNRCGGGGVACVDCRADDKYCRGQSCVACDADSCPRGCCTPDGSCQDGDTPSFCGSGGAACVTCPADQACINGVCRPCNAETCPGCCTRNLLGTLLCRPGNVSYECGAGGAPCRRCPFGEDCVNGVCLGCNAQSCPNGCCEGRFCQPGQSDEACGTGGVECANCLEVGFTCADGACEGCSARTCPRGCCDAGGTCRDGTSSRQCGTGGERCADCLADDKFCAGQVCRECGPETCPDGCCLLGTCLPGDSSFACGQGGVECDRCPSDVPCRNGSCAACHADTCPNGCCDENDECQPGTDAGACGSGGEVCARCAEGAVCQNQTCAFRCDETTCPEGCCDENNFCLPGRSPVECGRGGAPCANCQEDGLFCVDGVCQRCGPLTCPRGCCSTDGACLPGTADQACGSGGLPCDVCDDADGGGCVNQRCVSCGDNCPEGCCDADGACQSGTTNQACGAGGAACDRCNVVAGEACVDQVCVPCGRRCLDGCCDGDGVCQEGTDEAACGAGGSVCESCGVNERCERGVCEEVCNETTCPDGCCDPFVGCLAGTDDNACGTGGALCDNCLLRDEVCREQTCVGEVATTAACNPETCDGCCDGETCRPGTERTACGTGGELCQVCDWETTEKCVNGTCTTTCSEANCPDGCCSFGECVGGTSDFACGTNGEPCQHCLQRGEVCRDQVCVGAGESGRTEGCGAETCDTCCDGDTCVEATGDAACGAGGGECQDCAAQGARCADGACLCDQSSCPDGCCADTACQDGDEDTACGKNGETCEDCTEFGGRCINQMCAAPGPCPDGCVDSDGRCQEGTSPDACGPRGGTCQVCQAGEQCEDGSCVRQVGGRPTTRPDFAYAVVRPTDLPPGDAARAVVSAGTYYDGGEAGLTTGVLITEWVRAFGSAAIGTGYQQAIGLPAGGETAAGWDRTITTWHQFFDGSEVNLPGQVVPNLFAGPLANTTPLVSDPTIGDGAYFHGFSGQTGEGASFISTIGVFSVGPVLKPVRVDDYTGVSPDLGQVQDLTRTTFGRVADIWNPDYQNLGTAATVLPFGEDPNRWAFNGRYTAYDRTLFRLSSQDPAAFARDQERLNEIDRGYGLVQPLSIDEADDGPVFAYFATTSDQLVSVEAAQTHFGQLDGYLAEDGAAEGFAATRQSDGPEFPDIITPPDAARWYYERTTARGILPGTQDALVAGDTVTKFNLLGAAPIPPGGRPSAEYRATIDEFLTAAETDFLARRFGGSAAGSTDVAAAMGRFVDLQQACLGDEPDRCLEAEPVVTTEEEPATGSTAAAGPFDLAAAVITPVDAATTFGLALETFQAAGGFTFTGIENAGSAGFGGFETTPPRDQPAEPVRGHVFRWLHRDEDGQIDVNFSGVAFQTDADWISDWLTNDYLAGATEIPTEPDAGANVRLFEAEGQSVTGNPFYSQSAVYRSPSLVGFLDANFLGNSWDDEDDYWVVAQRYAGEFGGFRAAAYPGDTPLVQTYAERLAGTGRETLGTSLRDYTAPGAESNALFGAELAASDLSIGGVRQESHTVVDNQTIRQGAQSEEQHAHHVTWNRDVVSAVQRVEVLLSGSSTVLGSEATSSGGTGTPVLALGRAAARYTSDSAAAEGFANLEQRVDEAAALEPNLHVVPDRETESTDFGVDAKYFRYLRSSQTGQQAGVGLYLGYDDKLFSFDVFSPIGLPPEEGFAEPFVLQVLYGTAEAMALDHLNYNDREISQNVDDAAAELYVAYRNYLSGGDATVRPPIAEEPEVSESSPEGCPPGWVFDAAGPSGRGCYRCSYPHISGTVYRVEAHGCVRNGEVVEEAPRELVL